MQCARHGPAVLADVVEVHALAGAGKAVTGQVPDPHRAVCHDEHLIGPAQAPAHRLGPELFLQRVHPATGHDGATARAFP